MNFDATFWDDRYARDEFVYGTAPNDFVAAMATRIPAGPVLCLAEGEGRNAVFLATRGHAVTAVDQSAVGLAKAQRFAAARGAALTTIVADLGQFSIEPAAWSGVITTFGHLPPPLRREVFAAAVRGLRPGGVFLLEAYTPAQLAYDTGGPRDLELLMTADALRAELAGLRFEVLHEIERHVAEGAGHTGRAAVVQVCGVREA
ncbi:MAG: class I SAM-dependent methyltransferase [Opitutaceae bacterium]|nr:class I SAM-dependent methyltransferase [Opitutaceae bacterium]